MTQTSAKTANYIVAALAVLGIAFCWAQHFQAKQSFSNPLIPQSLSGIYYKPAILFTVLFTLVIVLQSVSIYFKKAHGVAAVFGLALLVGTSMCYPFIINWFLS
jgi:hypothetical protein